MSGGRYFGHGSQCYRRDNRCHCGADDPLSLSSRPRHAADTPESAYYYGHQVQCYKYDNKCHCEASEPLRLPSSWEAMSSVSQEPPLDQYMSPEEVVRAFSAFSVDNKHSNTPYNHNTDHNHSSLHEVYHSNHHTAGSWGPSHDPSRPGHTYRPDHTTPPRHNSGHRSPQGHPPHPHCHPPHHPPPYHHPPHDQPPSYESLFPGRILTSGDKAASTEPRPGKRKS